ncbi:nucleoprotein [Influenza B virus]
MSNMDIDGINTGTIDKTPEEITSGTSGTTRPIIRPATLAPPSNKRTRNPSPERATTSSEDDVGRKAQKKQTPTEIKKSVYNMVVKLGEFYNQMMVKAGLNDDMERNLIQNAHAVERILLAATDDKKTEFQKKKNARDVKEGKEEIDHNKTGGTFYKMVRDDKTIYFSPIRITFLKEEVKTMYKTTMGSDGFSGLNHIMIGHSQMNDVCFQRSKALKRVGLDPSLISTFAGSTVPRRSGATGVAIKGGGTLVAEAIRFIGRAMADRGLLRDIKAKTAYEKILLNLKNKCSAPQQKALVDQVIGSRNPGIADIEDLTLLARSMVVVRPSVASKVVLPISIYAKIPQLGFNVEEYSMVGYEAMALYNMATPVSILRMGDDAKDKSQLFFMSCFGAAYEDLRVLSALTGTEFKPRSALKCKGFHVPAKEQVEGMGAALMSIKLQFWAPMTRSGGNEAGGDGGSGQISCSPVFAVERPIALSKQAVRRMLSMNIEGRDADVKGNLLKMMNDSMAKKTSGNAFVGKKMFQISDKNKTNPIEIPIKQTIPNFFFGRDTAEDYDDLDY